MFEPRGPRLTCEMCSGERTASCSAACFRCGLKLCAECTIRDSFGRPVCADCHSFLGLPGEGDA